jgi:hypothetical protein
VLPLLTPAVAELVLSPLLGLDPQEGVDLPPRPVKRGGRVDGTQTHDQVVAFVMTLLRWAQERWLASPYVLEVLLITLLAWAAESPGSPRTGQEPSVKERQTTSTRASARDDDGGWGPWVSVLTSAPEEAEVGSLLQVAADLPHWQAAWQPAPPVNLALRPWTPEIETADEAEARLRRDFEKALARHLAEMQDSAADAGLQPSPVKTAGHHFEWLALRQVEGWRPSQIAGRFGVGASTVRAALADLSDLLELSLRPVKPGPEPW